MTVESNSALAHQVV